MACPGVFTRWIAETGVPGLALFPCCFPALRVRDWNLVVLFLYGAINSICGHKLKISWVSEFVGGGMWWG